MKNNQLLIISFITISLSFGFSIIQDKVRKSHIGEYSPAINLEQDSFFAYLELLNYEYCCPDYDNEINNIFPDSLPKIAMNFVNPTEELVVIEFPFNWSYPFVVDPVYFEFRIIEESTIRVESFYPDKFDSINDFLFSTISVAIPPKEMLRIDGFVNNNRVYEIIDDQPNRIKRDKITRSWELSLKFRYVTVDKKEEVRNKISSVGSYYATTPIEVIIK